MEEGKIQQEFYIRSEKAASHISLDGTVLASAIVRDSVALSRLFAQALPLKISLQKYLHHFIFPIKLFYLLIILLAI
jgi:hypothetical protein